MATYYDLQIKIIVAARKGKNVDRFQNFMAGCYFLLVVQLGLSIFIYLMSRREELKDEIEMAQKSFSILKYSIIANDVVCESIVTVIQFILVFNFDFESYGSFIVSVVFTIINFVITVREIMSLNDLSDFIAENKELMKDDASEVIDSIFEEKPRLSKKVT